MCALSFNSFSQSVLAFDDEDINQTMTDPIYDYIIFNLPNNYVYHKYSQNLYYYTPWKPDIFIKKIISNNGLNFSRKSSNP